VPSGASPDTNLHRHLKDIAMGDDFSDYDLDTPTEADLDLAYGSQYLGAVDLGDRKIRARIQKVRKAELTGQDGRKRTKFLVYFDAFDKPLVLNKTNKDALVSYLGKVPGKWPGATIGLFVDPNVMMGGKKVGGVRLRVLEPVKTGQGVKARRRQARSGERVPGGNRRPRLRTRSERGLRSGC
jgi:hypothetical protein